MRRPSPVPPSCPQRTPWPRLRHPTGRAHPRADSARFRDSQPPPPKAAFAAACRACPRPPGQLRSNAESQPVPLGRHRGPARGRLAVARGLADRATQLNRADRVAPQYVAQPGGLPPEIGSPRRGGSFVALGPPRADDQSLLAPVLGRRPARRPDLQAALRHPPPSAQAGVGPLVCSRSEHPGHQPQHAARPHAFRAPSDRGEDESGSA